MKIKPVLLGLSILLSGCATTQHSNQTLPEEHVSHWGYSGQEGPEFWGSLSSKNSACSAGVNQSPVNLTDFIESDLASLKMEYKSEASSIINNGHTIQVNYQPGSVLTVNEHSYELKQFHFHSPSENQIDGKSYPLEAHFVHADEKGNLAVVAVMFEENKENKTLKEIWALMPDKTDEENKNISNILIEGVLPSNREYYRFNGSLTTPPCSEGVLWLVMKETVSVGKGQIEHFGHTIELPNNRPVQGINSRAILK